jgi:hypothetical protein
MNEFIVTDLVFAAGLAIGATLDLLLLRTLLAPPFRIWPTPEPGSWQSLTFWGLFRGGMVMTFAVALLDWNGAGLLHASHFLIGLPLFLVGFGITVCGYFNLGLGNTYCGADGLVSHGRWSRRLGSSSITARPIATIARAPRASSTCPTLSRSSSGKSRPAKPAELRDYSAAAATEARASPATMRRAASNTSMPAPSRCAFSARWRRKARARGWPWNSPRMWRVI